LAVVGVLELVDDDVPPAAAVARPGDRVTLNTPSGTVSLPVMGVYYDYSTDAGAIMIEDLVHVLPNGIERLHKLPHELGVIS